MGGERNVAMVVLAAVIVGGAGSAGAVICKDKKKGTLAVRDACTKKQVAVDPATLAPGAATGGGLALGAGGFGIAPGGVGTPSLADGAVTTDKLADGAVTPAKLGVVPAVRVTNSTTQSAANVPTFTTLAFDTERFDTAALHTGSDTRLTAPIAGLYVVSAQISWDAASNVGARELAINRNGSTIIARTVSAPSPSPNTTEQSITTLANLAAGDFVEVKLRQNSGGSLTVFTAPEFSPEFSMVWVSPAP